MFDVLEKRCDQCLFSKNKVVSDARRTDILDTCKRENSHFICHKSTLAGGSACCRGHYDEMLETGAPAIAQIAQRLGLVNFVPVPKPKE